MKKLILSTALVGTMLLTACSSDELDSPKTAGAMTFTVEVPGGFQSRYSEGTTATSLKAYAYDIANGLTAAPVRTETATMEGKKATVTFNLISGHEYDIVFLATAPENSGITYDETARTFDVVYGTEGNRESLDAFYATLKSRVADGSTESVGLYRPFAQLNIGTDDKTIYEAAPEGGTISSVTVSVEQAYTTFDLMAEDVVADQTADVTFASTTLPTGDFTVTSTDPGKPYTYLAMNYVLAPKQKGIFNVKMHVNSEKDAEYANVPMQQNYRTNIYGSLLTKTNDYNVEIKPGYNDPDLGGVILPEGTVKMDGVVYNTLKEAIEAATGTEATIYLGGGTLDAATELVVPTSSPVTKLTVIGQGPNTIFNKNAGHNVKSSIDLVLENVTINTNGSNYNGFYHSGSETYTNCYINNALFLYGTTAEFNNCKFTIDADRLATTYNVWCYGAQTATFNHCEFNAGKSVLVYCENSAMNQTVNINDCTFNGTALNDGKAAVEVDCHRLGANYKYTLNFNNNTVSGYDCGNLSGKQLWNVKDGEKFEIFEDGKEVKQGLTTPDRSGNLFHVNTAEGLVVMSNVVNNGYYKDGVHCNETYSGKTFELTADIDMSGIDFTPIGATGSHFSGTFDGKDHTISNMTVNAAEGAGLIGHIQGTIKDVVFDNAKVTSHHWAGVAAGYCTDNAGTTISNITVKNSSVICTPENNDNGDKAGAVIGYIANSNSISKCYVENCYIKAYRDVAGISGACDNKITDSSVKNTVIELDASNPYDSKSENIAEIVGRFNTASNTENSNTVEGNTIVYSNQVYAAALTSSATTGKKIEYKNCTMPSITLNTATNAEQTVDGCIITAPSENPGGTARFGVFVNGNQNSTTKIINTSINGAWSHGIYVQGTNELHEQTIVVKGCNFADWGKKETEESDIKTSAAMKIYHVGNITEDAATRAAYASEFIANNTFDATTLGTGRVKLNLTATEDGSAKEYTFSE